MGVWTMDIPSIVFSRIVTDFSDELKEKYKMIKVATNAGETWLNFSTSQVSETAPRFPYITVIELPGAERGQDLEGTSINAALFTFQADVYCNGSIAGQNAETVVKNCMAEITRIMKSMMFSVTSMPSFDSKPQEYRMTARFQRTISKYDLV